MANKKYLGANGKKQLTMDVKAISIIKYLNYIMFMSIIIVTRADIIVNSPLSGETLYIILIIMSIIIVVISMIIVKVQDSFMLRVIKAILICICMRLSTYGIAQGLVPLLLIVHLVLIFIYKKNIILGEVISQWMDNPLVNALPKVALFLGVFTIPLLDVTMNTLLILLYILAIVTEIALLDIVNSNKDLLVKYKLDKYYM
ncbi:hypothetical protein RZE82_06435 [Mollicutes bacterium LVI A0039]|nr:hypothetical protein RZE82_06435 [Mollicutes bacterium LVI A0039]